jgi:four helix bundle protein
MAHDRQRLANINMFRYKNLEIWKLSKTYAEKCYNLANKFPPVEQYVLSEQLRRATVSISGNIIEGSISPTNKGFCEYLDMSIESITETENIFHIAAKRKYITEEERKELHIESTLFIDKINSFKNSLN